MLLNGAAVYTQPGSLKVDDAIEERAACSVILVDADGTLTRPRKGDSLQVSRPDSGGVDRLLFKGIVDSSKLLRIAPGEPSRRFVIKAVDYHYFADKRLAAKSYINQTAGAIVTDLITTYLAVEGITAGVIEAGPTILESIFNYVPVSEAIKILAEKANFWWYIDSAKVLNFRARSAAPSPWTATTADMLAGSISVEDGNRKYRNRQYIRGGTDITSSQLESKKGDGVQRDFALGYPIAQVPTVTVNGAAKTVGIKSIDTGKNWYWAKGDPVLTQERADAVLGTGDTLDVTYVGQFNIVTISEDRSQVIARQAVEGGSGYVEDVFDDAKIDTRAKAFDTASALLQKYALIGRTITFTTSRYGLAPGQALTIDLPLYEVNNVEVLISAVQSGGDTEARWKVTAVEGPNQGSWQRLFVDILSKAQDIIEFINTSEKSTLTVLVPFSENWAWGEAIVQTVFACPVPATTLNPSTTLYPC